MPPLSNEGRVIPPAGISEQGGGVWGEAIAAVIANRGGGTIIVRYNNGYSGPGLPSVQVKGDQIR